MPQQLSTDQSLRAENAELRVRLEDAEEMLRAIRAGEVDTLVMEGAAGPQLVTLQGLDAEQNLFCGAMLAQVSDAVIAVDTEERVTFLNAAAERQYGVRAGDVLGRTFIEIFTPHWLSPEAEAGMRTALCERGEWRGELIHRRRDGSELHVETSASALHDSDGAITGYVASIRDITERHQAEAALRRNTALFSKIIEQAPGGVYVVDAQFRVAQMNAESLPFFASAQPLIGRDFDEVLEIVWGPEIGPQCASIFRHTLVTGERYISPRFSEQRHDLGVEQAFEWETQRITLPDGQHGVVCYFQDVTARERAEAARRDSEVRLNLAVKCSQVVLFQQDLELRYTWLQNPVPGFEEPVAIGKRDTDLMERAADAAVTEALKREVIRSGVSQRQEVLVQVQGVGRHYDLLVEPQRDAAGLISGVTCAAIDITERKRAEEALRVSEEHYRSLVTASSDVVYQMSADWSEMHKLDGKDFIVDTTAPSVNWVEEYLYPEDQPQVLAVIREAIRTKSPFEMEHRVRRVDGSVGWTFSRAIPLLDAKGEIVEWFGAASDVTARKQAEEERRLLASIVEFSRDFIGISDTHGNPIYGNLAAMELVGIQDLEQVRRSKIIDYFIPEQRQFVEEVVLPAVATDGRWSGELTMQHFVTGATFPVWYDLFRVDDPVTGQPVNFATISRDLTESKRIEQALADRTELLNGVMEGTTDVIFVKDLNGRVLLANAAFAAAARSTPEQLVGKRDEELFPPDVAAEIRQHDEAVIAGGSPIQIEETIPVAGEARVFLTLKAPLRDSSGRVIGILGISRDITERNRAEEALRESEARFRAAVGAVSSLIWTNNSRGEMEGEQPGWGRFTGQSQEEYQGYGWARAVHPEDAQPTIDGWNQAVAEKRMFEFEHRVRRNDGEWRLCSIRAVPVLGEAGEIREWVGVHTDITERKAAEAALRESEERFRTLFASAPMAIFVCDHNAVIEGFNRLAVELWGREPRCGVERHCGSLKLWLPDGRRLPHQNSPMVEVLRTGIPALNVEALIERPDGSRLPVLVNFAALKNVQGQITGAVTTFIDITERKRAEEALRAGEEHMRLATEATEVGIWEWNLATNAIRWDAQMFRLYGVPPTEDGFVSYETWSHAVLPEDLARQEEVLQDTLRRLGKSTREFRILRADDGECRCIQSVETVRANQEGKAEWVIGTNLDVTEQKNAERAIREEAQRKDEFLAMLGHELRNPLNAIRQAVQISGETPDDAEACQWAANVIDRQSQQLSRMVDDLLDVARINRGRIELRVESLDLGPVLEQAIAAVRPLHTQRRQTFTSDIGSQLLVTGDAARLEQVFVNLLTNAAKYTPENGRISLHARNEDGEVVVTITDTGVGIPAELLPHVFDLFRQADSTLDRALGGLGIGLSVVKSLVEMHLGRVTIASAGANAGTTVTVRLPLLLELPATERPPAPRALDAAPSPILRVLIVDDHEDAAQALGRLLKRRGCEVRCAYSGPDGVTVAREFRPEVLLLDLGLPGFDGYELARRLRAEAPFAEAIFIAISGYAQDGDRARCLAADFDDHFAKPLDFPKLMEVIHTGNPPGLEPTVSKQSNHKVE